VLDGDPASSPKRGRNPQFSAHVYCGQTAAWIKMALGMEVGLSPGHIVLDGTQLPCPKRRQSLLPIFGPFLLWQNGWMHQDGTWYGGRPQPRDFVLPQKGRSPQCSRVLWPNGCMNQDATAYRRMPRPTRHCVRWGPSSHPL